MPTRNVREMRAGANRLRAIAMPYACSLLRCSQIPNFPSQHRPCRQPAVYARPAATTYCPYYGIPVFVSQFLEVSFPAPPSHLSLPPPPHSASLPAPPARESLPPSPTMPSLPDVGAIAGTRPHCDIVRNESAGHGKACPRLHPDAASLSHGTSTGD